MRLHQISDEIAICSLAAAYSDGTNRSDLDGMVAVYEIGAEIAADVGRELFGKLKAPIEGVTSAFARVPFSHPLESAFAPDRHA